MIVAFCVGLACSDFRTMLWYVARASKRLCTTDLDRFSASCNRLLAMYTDDDGDNLTLYFTGHWISSTTHSHLQCLLCACWQFWWLVMSATLYCKFLSTFSCHSCNYHCKKIFWTTLAIIGSSYMLPRSCNYYL